MEFIYQKTSLFLIMKVNNFLKKEAMFWGLRISSVMKLLLTFLMVASLGALLGALDIVNTLYIFAGSVVGCFVAYFLLRIQEQKYPNHHLDKLITYTFFQSKRIKP